MFCACTLHTHVRSIINQIIGECISLKSFTKSICHTGDKTKWSECSLGLILSNTIIDFTMQPIVSSHFHSQFHNGVNTISAAYSMMLHVSVDQGIASVANTAVYPLNWAPNSVIIFGYF